MKPRRNGRLVVLFCSIMGVILLTGALILNFAPQAEKASKPPENFRESMRQFVISIKDHGERRAKKPFYVVPQNGMELVVNEEGEAAEAYLAAIDGHGQESMFVGYGGDDVVTSEEERDYIKAYTNVLQEAGLPLFLINYATWTSTVAYAQREAQAMGAVNLNGSRELSEMPTGVQKQGLSFTVDSVETLDDVSNFMYLINPEYFGSDEEMVEALARTQYDMFVIDAFGPSGKALTKPLIARLQRKPNGSSRIVLAYMSIGEAESYRWYFKEEWLKPGGRRPGWLKTENPLWEGNFRVAYWDEAWQGIIVHNQDSYLNQIVDAGFSGVYLDIVDAFVEEEYAK